MVRFAPALNFEPSLPCAVSDKHNNPFSLPRHFLIYFVLKLQSNLFVEEKIQKSIEYRLPFSQPKRRTVNSWMHIFPIFLVYTYTQACVCIHTPTPPSPPQHERCDPQRRGSLSAELNGIPLLWECFVFVLPLAPTLPQAVESPGWLCFSPPSSAMPGVHPGQVCGSQLSGAPPRPTAAGWPPAAGPGSRLHAPLTSMHVPGYLWPPSSVC